MQAAVGAARSAKVPLCQWAHADPTPRGRAGEIGERSGLPTGALDRFEVASWVPLPDPDSPDERWVGRGYDVVVIDCLDEMLRSQAWPDADTILRHSRWLRECAQRSSTAVVITAAQTRCPGLATRVSWTPGGATGFGPAFDDVADSSCQIFLDVEGEIGVRLASRGGQRFEPAESDGFRLPDSPAQQLTTRPIAAMSVALLVHG